jgi:phosphoglycerol transferase
MKGRSIDLWERAVTNLPVDQMVKNVAEHGFNGIYIDRCGFPDRGSALESQLAALLKTQPLVSRNQRLSFFSFAAYPTDP